MKTTSFMTPHAITRTLTLLTLAFICSSGHAASPLKLDVSAGFTYDDNVTRAQYDNDIESDYYLSAGTSIAYSLPATDNSYFSLKGSAVTQQYDEYDKLSNTRLGAYASFHIKPFHGFTASVFSAEAAYIERMYKSDQRDGSETQLRLGFAKKLTDRLSLNGGYIKQDIDANSDVFDADNNRFYLDTELVTSSKNVVYLTLGYLDGNMVTTARGGLGIDYDIWVVDDAFTELSPLRWAYKLSGTAMTYRLGDVYVFNRNHSIDGSIFYYDAKADNYAGSYYKGYIYALNYLYRF
jgi:hypothetical protein